MPNGDDEKVKRLKRQIKRGAISLLRRNKRSMLPSNIQHAITDHNHRRQGIIPFGFGAGVGETKARMKAGKAQEKLEKMGRQDKADIKALKKVKKDLKNQNLNRARRMSGDSDFSSRNKYKSEDNKRISKPEF